MRHLIPLLLLVSSTLAADPTTQPSTLTVTGHGETSATPDHAVITFGVNASNEQAALAQDKVNQKMQTIQEALKQLGIDSKQIQTSTLSLTPLTQSRPLKQVNAGEEYISGYQATNTIQVQLPDLSKTAPTLDAGVKAGANRIDGISFQLKNDTEAKSTALKNAAADAKSKAAALAAALNLNLDAIEEVTEAGADVGPPRPMFRAMAQAAGTPVQPGQLQISAAITLRYRVSPTKP
jgi:uncharacterized protein YggE